MSKSDVKIAVTGQAWLGSGIIAIESVLERTFREAKHEILIIAYVVTGGADLLFEWIEGSLIRGVEVKIVINQLNRHSKNVITFFHRMNETYPHFHLYEFDPQERNDLHAKVIVTDRTRAFIGSSNLSKRGLHLNHELGIVIENSAAADVARAIDSLIASKYVYPSGNKYQS